MSEYSLYEGVGSTLEEAVSNAHAAIPLRQGTQVTDFMHSSVVDFGKRTGGFVGENIFYAKVIQINPAPVSRKESAFAGGDYVGNG